MNASKAALVFVPLLACAACHTTTGKSLLTPLTVVRDVVDAPVVSLTNVFDYWAEGSSKIPSASAGVSITPSGVSPGIHLNFSYWIFKPLSLIVGSVDYLVCRSLYPNWPRGISPWLDPPGQGWSDLYFPNTRALWNEGEDEERLAYDNPELDPNARN